MEKNELYEKIYIVLFLVSNVICFSNLKNAFVIIK